MLSVAWPASFMKAWQCIGCGKLDGPQDCIGCQDRKVELVYASDYDELSKHLAVVQADIAALAAQMRQIVNTTPRNGEWERSYRALQHRARHALEVLAYHTEKVTS
jgi:ABC-type phosphate/phosphonate transport system substrate-binding protein